MKATVRVDISGLSGKISAIVRNPAIGTFAATEAIRLMEPYVPMREGQLWGSAKASPFMVTFSTPYARRVYYGDGLNFRRDRHINARSRWDEGIDRAALANAITGEIGR